MPVTEAQARRHVHQLRSFYGQVLWFVAVNVALLGINLATDPDNLWVLWVAGFWGLGLFFNGVGVYRRSPSGLFGKDWEDRKVRELTKKGK